MIVDLLSRRDVANLRLASLSFVQLPQTYFHQLVKTEMPWVWEIESLQPNQIDGHELWRKLSAADGGPCKDEEERKWGAR